MPAALNRPLPHPGPTELAVGLQWPDPQDSDQFHLGLFVDHPERGVVFVGQGWHLYFHVVRADRLQAPTNTHPRNAQTWWHPLALRPATAEDLQDKLCSHIDRFDPTRWKAGVPYGFIPPTGPQFDPRNGGWLDQPQGAGLTCATYVMAVFRDFAGLEVVAMGTWESREPHDSEWQQRILDELTQDGQVGQEHLEQLKKHLGCVRFRPAEVAFAAASSPAALPLSYEQAKPGGRGWETQIRTDCGVPDAAPPQPPTPPAPGGTGP